MTELEEEGRCWWSVAKKEKSKVGRTKKDPPFFSVHADPRRTNVRSRPRKCYERRSSEKEKRKDSLCQNFFRSGKKQRL